MPSSSAAITDLGPEIILFHILPQLEYSDIVALTKIKNHTLRQILNTSFVYQLLFRKQFGEDTAAPLAITANNWPQLYRLRLTSKLYTWGKSSGGRLGYRIDDVPRENITMQLNSKNVSKPTEVKAFYKQKTKSFSLPKRLRLGLRSDTNSSNANVHANNEEENVGDNHDGIILVDVSAGGYTFEVLSSNGNVFTIGHNPRYPEPPAPSEPDYDIFRDADNQQVHNLVTFNNFSLSMPNPSSAATRPEAAPAVPGEMLDENDFYSPASLKEIQLVDKNSRFISHRELPRTENTKNLRIVTISSGRSHFIALDSKNQVWSWDRPDQQTGVRLKFTQPNNNNNNNNKSIIENPAKNIITKILAGWSLSSCFIQGIGLVIWNTRDPLRKGNRIDDAVNVNLRIIRNTSATEGNKRVVDYFLGENFLLYVTADGYLHRLDIDPFDHVGAVEAYDVLSFNNFLDKQNGESNNTNQQQQQQHQQQRQHRQQEREKFIKIVGNFRNFAIFTNFDKVLLGTKDSTDISKFDHELKTYHPDSRPQLIPELQHKKCINVTMGDYHCLALFADGELVSWGLESQSCGSLGLGSFDEIREKNGGRDDVVRREGWGDMRVHRPTKVELGEGKVALAVAASGWQSSAIIATKV